MNGSIFFKEEKKRRGIFIEVLKNVDVNEVERLFKVEYRRIFLFMFVVVVINKSCNNFN